MSSGRILSNKTGGAVFFPMRGENTRERWSPFKGEGDGGCSKRCYEGIIIVLSNTGEHLIFYNTVSEMRFPNPENIRKSVDSCTSA